LFSRKAHGGVFHWRRRVSAASTTGSASTFSLPNTAREGFTLIELSIVLVVIGLIVGGIFVGLDLVHAAGLRSTVSQIEKYNAATNTFRIKFNALPGDMSPTDAAAFGFLQLNSGASAPGIGDNNGLLQDGNSCNNACGAGTTINGNQFCGEIATFWVHLSQANLTDGQFGLTGNSLIDAPHCRTTGSVSTISQSIPAAKLGNGLYITVSSSSSANYFDILPVTSIANGGNVYSFDYNHGMTPTEAHELDVKIDDGMPETGNTLAILAWYPTSPVAGSPASMIGWTVPSAAAISTSTKCVIGTGAALNDTYNLVASTGGNDRSCGLAFRFH